MTAVDTGAEFFEALDIYACLPREQVLTLERHVERLEESVRTQDRAPSATTSTPAIAWPDGAALLHVVWLLRGKFLVMPRRLRERVWGRTEIVPELWH